MNIKERFLQKTTDETGRVIIKAFSYRKNFYYVEPIGKKRAGKIERYKIQLLE